MRSRLLVGLGLAISAFFLFQAFQGLNPQAFFAGLAQVNLWAVLLGALVFFVSVVLIAWRWQFFLNPVKRLPLGALTGLVCVGYMGNNVYPLRAGEALRVFLLLRRDGVPIVRSTTTIVIERIFDGAVMLAFILVGLAFAPLESPVIDVALRVGLPVFGLGLAGFFLVALLPTQARQLAGALVRWLPSRVGTVLLRLLDDVLAGLGALQHPLQLADVTLASFASWLVGVVVYWLVFRAFGLELSFAVALLVVGAVNLAGLIPASPGQFGVYEYVTSTILMAFGVAQETALSYAVVVHLTIWLPVTLVGFGLLAWYGLGLGAVAQARTLAQE